jgi:hypothetical protein
VAVNPTDPLNVRVLQAARDLAVTLVGSNVPAAQVYNRSVLQYSHERDGCPALLVSHAPGQTTTRRRTLDGTYTDTTYPLSVVLVTPGNLQPATADPKRPTGAEAEWRSRLRDIFELSFHGRPGACWPSEVKYLRPLPEAFLDLSAYEAAGLWWAAVSFGVFCRVTN